MLYMEVQIKLMPAKVLITISLRPLSLISSTTTLKSSLTNTTVLQAT
jgi:hypothetical protein